MLKIGRQMKLWMKLRDHVKQLAKAARTPAPGAFRAAVPLTDPPAKTRMGHHR